MEFISGNIFIRTIDFRATGDVIEGHVHNFDHTTIVHTGAVHVLLTCPDGTKEEKSFYAPSHFLVKADCLHEITALLPGTVVWCVYSHHTPQGEISQEYSGWPDAYR